MGKTLAEVCGAEPEPKRFQEDVDEFWSEGGDPNEDLEKEHVRAFVERIVDREVEKYAELLPLCDEVCDDNPDGTAESDDRLDAAITAMPGVLAKIRGHEGPCR